MKHFVISLTPILQILLECLYYLATRINYHICTSTCTFNRENFKKQLFDYCNNQGPVAIDLADLKKADQNMQAFFIQCAYAFDYFYRIFSLFSSLRVDPVIADVLYKFGTEQCDVEIQRHFLDSGITSKTLEYTVTNASLPYKYDIF